MVTYVRTTVQYNSMCYERAGVALCTVRRCGSRGSTGGVRSVFEMGIL